MHVYRLFINFFKTNFMIRKITFFILSLSFSAIFAQPYSNGGLSTGVTSYSNVTAPTGYTWSECQNITGNTTEANTNSGYSGMYNTANSANFLIADDFVVPSGNIWDVSSFEFFCYQTSYTGTTPPIDVLRIQIWNGDPSLGTSTLVAGDLTTNVYDAVNSSDALMYRIFHSTIPAASAPTTTRKIWKVRGNLTVSLPAGTYWVVYQVHATNDGSVFVPPVTIVGSRGLANWNAKQKNVISNTWSSLIDSGNPATAPDFPQDMPFNVNYVANLSVSEFNSPNVKLFPNPTNDSFVLSTSDLVSSLVKGVEIYNIQGQKVKEFSVQENYSIKDLTSGIYIAKLIGNSNEELQNIKIVKE